MKSLFTFFLIATVFGVSAQDGVIVKYFDSLWRPTSKENASFYTHFIKEDTLYKCTSYYAKSNKLYGKSTFADTLFTRGKGRGLMLRYYENGGLKDSTVFNNYGEPLTHHEFYENGNSMKAKNTITGVGTIFLLYYPNGKIKDSIIIGKEARNYTSYKFSDIGVLETLIYFDKDSNSIVTNSFDKLGNIISKERVTSSDIIFTSAEIEPSFPGGLSAWVKYLQHNLRADLPARQGAPAGKYVVFVDFIVNIDGTIGKVTSENDPRYGAREEAIRVISKSPNWIPAVQNGYPVKFCAKQLITFAVSDK